MPFKGQSEMPGFQMVLYYNTKNNYFKKLIDVQFLKDPLSSNYAGEN
jgi:hypothetical protein